jgi:hypothetical protein
MMTNPINPLFELSVTVLKTVLKRNGMNFRVSFCESGRVLYMFRTVSSNLILSLCIDS